MVGRSRRGHRHTSHTPHAAAGAPDTAARCRLVGPRWSPCDAAGAVGDEGDEGDGDGSSEFPDMVFIVSASVSRSHEFSNFGVRPY